MIDISSILCDFDIVGLVDPTDGFPDREAIFLWLNRESHGAAKQTSLSTGLRFTYDTMHTCENWLLNHKISGGLRLHSQINL